MVFVPFCVPFIHISLEFSRVGVCIWPFLLFRRPFQAWTSFTRFTWCLLSFHRIFGFCTVKISFVSTNQIISTPLWVCGCWICCTVFVLFDLRFAFNSTENARSQHAYKNDINFHLFVSYINYNIIFKLCSLCVGFPPTDSITTLFCSEFSFNVFVFFLFLAFLSAPQFINPFAFLSCHAY